MKRDPWWQDLWNFHLRDIADPETLSRDPVQDARWFYQKYQFGDPKRAEKQIERARRKSARQKWAKVEGRK